MSVAGTVERPTRPVGWPARSERRVALTGTIGGLAERLGAPADFIRALLIVAAFAQPWVFAGYVAAAVVLADPGKRRPGLGSLVAAARIAALFGLIQVAGSLPGLTPLFEGDEPSRWIPFSSVVVAGLAALLVRRRSARGERSGFGQRDAVLAATPFVLCASGLALAVVLAPDVRWERYLPIPALLAGMVLLARPRAALARAAILPAVTFAIGSLLAIGADVRLDGGVGDTTLYPRTAAELPHELRRGVGDVALDLTHLRAQAEPLAVDASIGVGSLKVNVPPRTLVEIDARLGQGRLSLDRIERDERDGRVIARGIPTMGRQRLRPRLRLRLKVRAGLADVRVNGIGSKWELR